MVKRKQDDSTGKFIKSENDLSSRIYLRCDRKLKEWIEAKGSDYHRNLLLEAMNNEVEQND
ncbi:hypothetical protein [Nostoc sp.]|uniref:hypothetical protein n=1 Tax=Nostoc sp. TaxID=1180 RepID=UPI002FF7660F